MKTENVVLFNNNKLGNIRALSIDGKPWFVGKDVAVALGYKNTKDALAKHIKENQKGVAKCDSLGGLPCETKKN